MIELIVKGLAAWRLSYLLINERGPFDLVTKFRSATGVEHDVTGRPVSYPDNHVLECIWCTTIWAGIGFALLPKQLSFIEKALAVAAVAVLIEDRPRMPPFPPFGGLLDGPSANSNSVDAGSLLRASRAASSAREPGSVEWVS